ncbi:MAG: hypothetical protein AAF184_11765 [Pseudomonadota bacterium]
MADDEWIDLIQPEMSGGKIAASALDVLDGVHDAKIRISGLRQDTFEYLISRYGVALKQIEFFKCPRVPDLSPLEDLDNVERISYYLNRQAKCLWDVSKNSTLRSLEFTNFTSVTDLSPLAGALSLERLCFGNAATGSAFVSSLEPLGGLKGLTHLEMNPKQIEDGRACPLTQIPRLESLEFNNSHFSTEKVAWLRARLPERVQSDRLAPYVERPGGLLGDGQYDVMVVGKRKPFLTSSKDAARISRYADRFWALVERFRADPALPEPP